MKSLKRCPTCKTLKPLSDFGKDCTTKTGLKSRCKICSAVYRKEYYYAHRKEMIQKTNRWRKKNKEKDKEHAKTYRQRLKREVMEGYGGKCVCCGEKEIAFLTVEHINHDGKKHRMEPGQSLGVYRFLIREKFPPGYTILCMNCNFATRYRETCPHQLKSVEE